MKPKGEELRRTVRIDITATGRPCSSMPLATALLLHFGRSCSGAIELMCMPDGTIQGVRVIGSNKIRAHVGDFIFTF